MNKEEYSATWKQIDQLEESAIAHRKFARLQMSKDAQATAVRLAESLESTAKDARQQRRFEEQDRY